MKPVIIIAIAFVLLFVPVSAFAGVGYDLSSSQHQFSNQPIVCIYEPSAPEVRQVIVDLWMKETDVGVRDWEFILKVQEPRAGDKWHIETKKISLDDQPLFDNEDCDVEIRFDATAPDAAYAGLHWFDGVRNQILIVYTDLEVCKTWTDKYYRYTEWCYKDDYLRAKALGNIATHEFGHAISLGHYTSDDPQENLDWSTNPYRSPSVMTEAVHYNEEKNKIRQIDIDKVKEIYDFHGFGKPKQITIDEPEPQPLSTPESSGTEILQVEPYKTTLTKIIGVVPDRLFSRGMPVEIQITNPDGTQESAGVVTTKRGNYEYIIQFDSKSLIGKYEILSIYKDEVIQKNFIELITKEFPYFDTKAVPTNKIPEWVKNNAKWWSEGQIDDDSFIQGIQFLIKEKVMTISSTEQKTVGGSNEIPDWIKYNAGWWADGLIDEDAFVNGIKWLVEKGIIRV